MANPWLQPWAVGTGMGGHFNGQQNGPTMEEMSSNPATSKAPATSPDPRERDLAEPMVGGLAAISDDLIQGDLNQRVREALKSPGIMALSTVGADGPWTNPVQ